MMTKQNSNTLTLVDGYGNSHIIHSFGEDDIHQAMKDIINILRYAGFLDKTISKGLEEADLDF